MTKANKTYSVHLQNVQTNNLTFLKVEDCKDMDDCIEHVRKDYPFAEWDLTHISPIK